MTPAIAAIRTKTTTAIIIGNPAPVKGAAEKVGVAVWFPFGCDPCVKFGFRELRGVGELVGTAEVGVGF